MAVRKVEEELAKLAASEDPAALRKALAGRINVLAAKAARMAAERQWHDLIPDLLAAFDRLLEKPVERDPQCWGKNAISKALVELGYRESAPFLRGVAHIQMEPVWGGQEDTASALRGTCVLALAACGDIPREKVLRKLADALCDRAEPVRVEAARALAQMEGEEGALLLRLKARMGDREPGVTGQVFDCLLQVERGEALEFVAGFLKSEDEAAAEEAALALGASRMPGAIEILRAAWKERKDEMLLRAISASRLEEAIAFLVELARDGRMKDAAAAVEALALHKESSEIRKQVEEAVAGRERELAEVFRARFGKPREGAGDGAR